MKTTKTAKKILIGEDEKPMAHALELKFNSSGFEAKAVNDGEAVLAELKNAKYDLVLLDLMMPKKDGFAVLSELKAAGNKVPVVVSSNLNQQEDFKRAQEFGAVDYFVKSDTPINEVINKAKIILKIK